MACPWRRRFDAKKKTPVVYATPPATSHASAPAGTSMSIGLAAMTHSQPSATYEATATAL